MQELTSRNISFRSEQNLQDISTEPAAHLIVDLLSIVSMDRAPQAYSRLMEVLESSLGDFTGAVRKKFLPFVDLNRRRINLGEIGLDDQAARREIVHQFFALVGPSTLAGMSSDYAYGNRLEEVVSQTLQRIDDLCADGAELNAALSRFSDDNCVRIMSVHKSKGLEFDTVIALGIEDQLFFGEEVAERSAFFVQVSRAKRRLIMTHVDYRERPAGYARRWDEERSPQNEFLGYALDLD